MAIITPEADAHARRLCSRLAIERTALGLTQRDLAAHFGDQQGNVQTIETMGRRPTLPTFVSYASALGLNVALVADYHLPLLNLTADEVMAVQIATSNYADTMPSESTIPGMRGFVTALRSALDKLTTTEETDHA